MSGLFGKPSHSVTPEIYTGIQVSTSLMGRPVPYVAGRQRMAFNLLWYGNFQSHGQSSGGKGGGGQDKSFTYSTAFIAGLCLGPIKGITRIWHDKALETLTTENLALSLGGSGPAVWSGYPSNTPAVQKIGYDHVAYVASNSYNLGSSASMPNLTFEVEGPIGGYADSVGIFDADPSAIIVDYLTDPVRGANFIGTIQPLTGSTNTYQAYCMAMGLLVSPLEDTARQATDYIAELLQITNSDCFLSVGTLKIIPYADQPVSGTTADGKTWSYTPNLTPIFIFGDDDYCPNKGEPPVKITRRKLSETYNTVNVEYVDRTNYYNPAPVNASDLNDVAKYGPRVANTLNWHQITNAQTAKTAAQLWLQMQLYERNTYEFRVRADYALLEPMDYIGLNDAALGLSGQVCRILSIEDDAENFITIKAMEIPGTVRSTPQYNWSAAQGYAANYAAAPGSVAAPMIFAMPAVPQALSDGITVGIAVCGPQTSGVWGGCKIYYSVDGGTNYFPAGVVPGPGSRYGTLATSLPAVADPDVTSTLSVILANNTLQLSPVTHAQADANQTMLLVGTGGNAEVMSYGNESLVSPGQYNLSYLRRGLYGSSPMAQPAGAPWARIDGDIFEIAFDPGQAGQTVYFKFPSFNMWGQAGEDISTLTAYPYTIPYATPVLGAGQMIPRGFASVNSSADQIVKTTTVPAWDSDAYSKQIFPSGCQISWSVGHGHAVVGISTNPFDTGGGTYGVTDIYNLSYGIEVNIPFGTLWTWENPTRGKSTFSENLIVSSGVMPGDVISLRYDGYQIQFIRNGVVLVTKLVSGLSVYVAAKLSDSQTVVSNLEFGQLNAALPTEWVSTGTCAVTSSNLAKIGGANAWDSGAYTVLGFSTCHITAKINDPTHKCFVGLSKSPSASPSFTNANYSWINESQWNIYESGSLVVSFNTPSTSDVPTITYDGSTVTYYLNGVSKRTVSVSGLTLYGQVGAFYPGLSGLNSLRFGSTTNLAVTDTSQIGANAATAIFTSTVAGPVNIYTTTISSGTTTTITSIAIPTFPYDTTLVVTVTGTVDHHANNAQFSSYVIISQLSTPIGTVGIESQIARNASTASPDAGGSWAIENTISLLANTTTTLYLYATGGGVSASGSFVNIYNVNMKVEVIKR